MLLSISGGIALPSAPCGATGRLALRFQFRKNNAENVGYKVVILAIRRLIIECYGTFDLVCRVAGDCLHCPLLVGAAGMATLGRTIRTIRVTVD